MHFLYLDDNMLDYYEKPYDKKKYKNTSCVNCGELGHIIKDCKEPITSFGVIAYKIVWSKLHEIYDIPTDVAPFVVKQDISSYPKIKFLMVQRKDTMAFVDFVRGKYDEYDEQKKNILLTTWLNEMTMHEKKMLLTHNFDQLWDYLWLNKNSRTYKNEYELAKYKYLKLNIPKLLNKSIHHYAYQEFGFPKGRKSIREDNLECAQREFHEETSYSCKDYNIQPIAPLIEQFIGTNGISYKHIYYIAKMNSVVKIPTIDYSNYSQAGEIKNVCWLTYNECMQLIRPYDVEKKNILTTLYHHLIKTSYTRY